MEQLDPQVLAITKAIRQVESGGNFNARSKDGSFGAYQFIKPTWDNTAKKYGVNAEWEKATPQQQNEVAYKQIKEWKDKGYNVGQVASMWNAGAGRPNAYLEGLKGTNKDGVNYNVTKYAEKVAKNYQAFKNGSQTSSAPVENVNPDVPPIEPEKKEGFWRNLVKSPATIIARPFQAIAELGGASAETVDRVTNKLTGGLVAPVPQNAGDVKKDIGRAAQTVAFGMGPVSGGAAFGLGNSLEQGNDLLSAQTALQTGVGAAGGKVLDVLGKPILNAVGKGLGKVVPQAAQDAANTGLKAVDDFMSSKQILPKNVSQAINTGAERLETGFNKPFEVAGNATKAILPKPKNIMNRVARLTPTDAAKFEKMTGKSHGEYLTETGNFGKPEKIVENEYKKFIASKQSADDALATLPGVYQDKSIEAAINELLARENRIGFGGGDANRIQALANKYENGGLEMKEVNEVKRLFERNNKLDYLRANVPEGIEKANRIDDAIRKWQFRRADALGLKNLPELNKQTQASKFIVDKLGKQIAGRVGNEAVTITDWMLLSGGDPSAIAGLAAKKFFGNKTIQSKIAKSLAPEPTVGLVKPEYGSAEGFLLPAPKKGSTPFSTLPMSGPKSTTYEPRAQKVNRTSLPGQLQLPAGNKNIVNGPTLRLPAKTQSLIDALERANPNIKIPVSKIPELLQLTAGKKGQLPSSGVIKLPESIREINESIRKITLPKKPSLRKPPQK